MTDNHTNEPIATADPAEQVQTVSTSETPAAPKKRRRRFGDRSDGRRLRTLPPISRVSPYIMKTRNTASNSISDSVEISNMERYIRRKRQEGLKNFGAMHVFLAAYIRTVSQRPAINRFIGGQKIFARNNIEIALTIKKDMQLNSPDTCVKAVFQPDATAEDVYETLNAIITREKKSSELDSSFDSTAKILRFIPGLLLKFTVWVLTLLDYFDLLPKKLLAVSPFHGSLVITSMGSLGIPPIYHHLYDFGNVPLFLAFGAKRRAYETTKDGTVEERRYIDYKVVTDERICDGFYYASALKYIKHLLKNPAVLSERPTEIIEDID